MKKYTFRLPIGNSITINAFNLLHAEDILLEKVGYEKFKDSSLSNNDKQKLGHFEEVCPYLKHWNPFSKYKYL